MKKTIEFTGINSGDYECFCWDVDIETFKRIKGEEPDIFDYVGVDNLDLDGIEDEDLDSIKPIDGKFRLYPNDIFQRSTKVKIKIEVEILDIQCNKCGIFMKHEDLKLHNKCEIYDNYICNNCLSKCSICGELFADYDNVGKCDKCAD